LPPQLSCQCTGGGGGGYEAIIGRGNGANSEWSQLGTSTLNDGSWHHVVGVDTGSTVKIYVDGVLEIDSTPAGYITPTTTTNSLTIGRRSVSADSYFNGLIDEVAIWNRTLSAQEIINLYKRGVLRLNLSVRSCDDASCNGEEFSEVLNNQTGTTLNETITPINRYFQYKAVFNTEDVNFAPVLYNITINYTTSGGENPLSCGIMANNDVCQLNFTINASGNIGSHLLLDVNFSSDDSSIAPNDTEDHLIKIIAPVVVDTTPPIVNTTFNITNPNENDIINFTGNVTDETGLLSANWTVNLTTGTIFMNYSLSGLTEAQVSNTTSLPNVGVFNFTLFVTDTSNNVKQNSTIITVTDPDCDIGTRDTLCIINTIRGVNNNTVKYYNDLTIQNGGALRNQTLTAVFNISANIIIIEDGGYIEGSVNINASNLTILSGGFINITGKGFAGGTATGGDGNGPGGGDGDFDGGQGAGYGGQGGAGDDNPNTLGSSYGSITIPLDLGSGGGDGNDRDGGNGGGAIHIKHYWEYYSKWDCRSQRISSWWWWLRRFNLYYNKQICWKWNNKCKWGGWW